ncbi:MAG: hypothetical protein KUG82_16950 [Pseudomonadales bacterium]|nr:hypothetical protein [Pseudomonadales bacterium]
MNLIKTMAIAASAIVFLVACSPDEPRYTHNSEDLTGLWRMQVSVDEQILAGSAMLITDLGETLELTHCDGSNETMTRVGNDLVIEGNNTQFLIIDNDHIVDSTENVTGEITKMSVDTVFDMGTLSLTSDLLPSEFMEGQNCTWVDYFSSGLQLVSIAAVYNGNPIEVNIAPSANAAGEYDIESEVSLLRLTSQSFVPLLGSSQFDLDSGTLTITKYSEIWFSGSIESVLPDGSAISLDFEVELP